MKSSVWSWILVPFGIGLLLLLYMQGRWIDLQLGMIGSLLVLITAWVAIWFGSRHRFGEERRNDESSVSLAEKQNWAALFFTAFVGVFLAGELDVIAAAASASELRGLGKAVTSTLIAWIILSAVLRHGSNQRVARDERDREIRQRADAASHTAICVAVIGFAVTLGFSPAARLAWATPLLLAHLLILALIVSSFIGHASAAWSYWRDRR